MKWLYAAALAVCCLDGCSSRAESETSFSQPTASPVAPGTVKISERSRAYVVTQPAALGSNAPLVRAPARVAFRDGAVSEVDTPTPGRITAVHVKLGDKVKP